MGDSGGCQLDSKLKKIKQGWAPRAVIDRWQKRFVSLLAIRPSSTLKKERKVSESRTAHRYNLGALRRVRAQNAKMLSDMSLAGPRAKPVHWKLPPYFRFCQQYCAAWDNVACWRKQRV